MTNAIKQTAQKWSLMFTITLSIFSKSISYAQTTLNFEPIYTTGGANYVTGNYDIGAPGQYFWTFTGAIPTDRANIFIVPNQTSDDGIVLNNNVNYTINFANPITDLRFSFSDFDGGTQGVHAAFEKIVVNAYTVTNTLLNADLYIEHIGARVVNSATLNTFEGLTPTPALAETNLLGTIRFNYGTNIIDRIEVFVTLAGSTLRFQEPTFNVVTGLPIELINFNAEANEEERSVSLTWQTQSEINNDYFEVQRSTDFQNWTSVEQVDGAGDSEELLNYTARDLNPLTGISYYRLKQIDEDGQVTYSDVRSVKLDLDLGDELLTIFPNPAITEFTVYGERLFPEDFSLFNSLGESVPLVVKASNDDMIVYSIEGMEKGIYFLNYNTGIEILHKKVLIE